MGGINVTELVVNRIVELEAMIEEYQNTIGSLEIFQLRQVKFLEDLLELNKQIKRTLVH